MMMSNPEVSYSRPQHPDKTPRPPPKSFADFQSAADAAKNPDSGRTSFIPKPGATEPSSPHGGEGFSQAEVRMSLLEQRIEQLEGELEELTEAATKPATASSSSATFVARMVRLAVVEAIVSPEAALLSIAQELGIIESARTAMASPNFRPPPAAAKPPPPVTRAEPPPAPETETARGEPQASSRRHAGRPSDAMRKAQAGPRKAIAAILEKNGLSQSKVAKVGGVPQTALSRWLRGGVTFDSTFIPKVEKAIQKLI